MKTPRNREVKGSRQTGTDACQHRCVGVGIPPPSRLDLLVDVLSARSRAPVGRGIGLLIGKVLEVEVTGASAQVCRARPHAAIGSTLDQM